MAKTEIRIGVADDANKETQLAFGGLADVSSSLAAGALALATAAGWQGSARFFLYSYKLYVSICIQGAAGVLRTPSGSGSF